ncbi:MAG: hypothetical protein AB7Q97_03440 [Gammaproteobacteria bacterium]
MHPFERVLNASGEELLSPAGRGRGPLEGDPDRRLERFAQRLGLTAPQLVCAIGFGRASASQDLLTALGFKSHDALAAERNYIFINDIYQQLSIELVLEIYPALRGAADPQDQVSDLIMSRITHIEGQIESTINPVMIGSYKLEIRALYENGLASGEFLATRLRPEYEVLRGITDEVVLIARSGAMTGASLLAEPGVTAEEKRRLFFHDLVSRAAIQDRLAAQIPARERKVLTEALGGP